MRNLCIYNAQKIWIFSLLALFLQKIVIKEMLEKLFKTAISLIFKPSEAWKELSLKQNDDHESFLSGYVYPFIGLITLATFAGFLFARRGFDLQIAIKESIVIVLSMFGGFFLASYFINETRKKIFHRTHDIKLCQCFVGYSSSLIYSLHIVLSLIPEFFFLRILVIYTIYIVWEGAMPYMDIKESEQLKFTGISTLIIILTPLAIAFIAGFLMPGLK